MKTYIFVALSLVLIISSCKKDEETTPSPDPSTLNIQVSHAVDANVLYFDSLLYTNEAGYDYAISRVWYYLSNVRIIRSDSSEIKILDYRFIDVSRPTLGNIDIGSVAKGSYIGLAYCIGLDSASNQSYSLPATTDNQNMEWPDGMGGGYHFLKFEGHFVDSGNTFGFAMHIGTNNYLVNGKLWAPITLGDGVNTLNVEMNMNEWFKNPAVYDFNMDGNYSMSSMMAMEKLMMNGADVLKLK